MARPLGFELLWALRHNFILIYFRVFRDISIIRLGELIDFTLISLMDMLSLTSVHLSACITVLHRSNFCQLSPIDRSVRVGRRPPPIFLTLKWEGRAVQQGGSDPPNPPGKLHPASIQLSRSGTVHVIQ